MATASKQEEDLFVIIDDVSPEAYEKILAALGEHRLRHRDEAGTLEMPCLLQGVSWEQYEALLDALGDHYLRHTYDRGTLEIMSPSRDHEWIKKFIGRMIETMAYELNIPIQSVGSTTQRRKPAKRGLQPDESYYVAHEYLVRGRRKLDPKTDPPPDLVVEVDVTSSSLKRMPVYAALGVPEVWRHDLRQLTFNKLGKTGAYQPIRRSLAFPFLRPEDVARFVDQLTEKDENAILREFVVLANVLAAKRQP
ncbi:MAG TPA: Uma2 family endonuclease [Pirellulales bacterium]|nr:Uma2 family endonuclease [Pirellulales bacterium]